MATTSDGAGGLSSVHLRDFLRIKEEEDHHNILNHRTTSNGGVDRNPISGLTLSALLCDGRRPPAYEPPPPGQSSRTLLDIIRDEQDPLRGDGGEIWRQFTEKFRVNCSSAGGSDWTPISPEVTINNTTNNRVIPRGLSSFSPDPTEPNVYRPRPSTERAIGRSEGVFEGEGGGADTVEAEEQRQTGRVSLMTLLAETDGHMGLTDTSMYILEEREEEKSINLVEVSGGGGGSGGGDNNCCVCMVRGKGAAFIPCGHTFCRLCSRQLFVERQNCPLCNAHILEILDIF